MTVADIVKHLLTLPQDLTVVGLWDEGGTYHDRDRMPEVKEIVKSNNSHSYGGEEWTDAANDWADEDGEPFEVYERRTVVVV